MAQRTDFESAIINGFKSGSVIIDSTLKFKSNQSKVLKVDDVVNSIKQTATANPSFKVKTESISVIEIIITSTTTTTTTTTSPTKYYKSLKMTLNRVYSPNFQNSSSFEYRNLSNETKTYVCLF